MGLINWFKGKKKVSPTPEIRHAAVLAFENHIDRYPRSYFLRKGPRIIRVNTDTHRDLPFPYNECEVIGWVQRGV